MNIEIAYVLPKVLPQLIYRYVKTLIENKATNMQQILNKIDRTEWLERNVKRILKKLKGYMRTGSLAY